MRKKLICLMLVLSVCVGAILFCVIGTSRESEQKFDFSYKQACKMFESDPLLFQSTATLFKDFALGRVEEQYYYVYNDGKIDAYHIDKKLSVNELTDELYVGMLECFEIMKEETSYDSCDGDIVLSMSCNLDEKQVDFCVSDKTERVTFYIIYSYSDETPDSNYTKITDGWYYYVWYGV